jgi:hypothetical protein
MGPVSLNGVGDAADPCQDVGMATSGPVTVQQGTGGGPMEVLVQSGIAMTRGGLTLAVGHGLIVRD